jgi:TPR repeat protein
MNGLGVERNYTTAKKYFDLAVQGDVVEAHNALGYLHYNGLGVPRNLTEGEKHLRKAADFDDPDAAFNLAALYQVYKLCV